MSSILTNSLNFLLKVLPNMNKGIQISRQIQKRVLEYARCPEIDSPPSFPPILDKGLQIDLAPTNQGVKGSQTTFAHIFYSVGFCLFSFLNITQLDCNGNVFNLIP